ncbi:MAG: cation transporter [Chlorobi bacterium]|nr:cation transporter [Chlorobiota bacterium]
MLSKHDKLSYSEGVISIVVNFILFGLKYWAGIVSGSVALIADAWHTLSDSLSSVFVIAGVKLSSKKPDKEHPFGHGRWEQITSIFIGFLLGIIAYEFLKESIDRFSNREAAHFGTIAIVVTVVSIVVKEGLAQYAFYIGRATKNLTVKADGWHHRTDSLSSVVVLAGIMLRNYFWWIDSVLGIIISLMIVYAAYEIVKQAINKLLGEEPPEELLDQIKDIIREVEPRDLRPHHFHIHNYVRHTELTFHIKFEKDLDIDTAHQIATKIEDALRQRLNIESTIHIEPLGVKHYD